MTDMINHPSHYTSLLAACSCGKAIECIQVTQHMSFTIGNAVKYLWRHNDKGAPLEDLKKARWYIDQEIKLREADALTERSYASREKGQRVFDAFTLGAFIAACHEEERDAPFQLARAIVNAFAAP